ncbi:nucleotidyltransferase substrate binding protein [Haemophilus influenzae]|uniref:nucleotidyltransferase substrate binding protein n=1 Tax=Haemophilus influenzae TaxID=727 RepID=UPI000DD4D13A|nr:nucleotidyltransferase substrate binding protein [Haemophilus influenzae]
MRSNNRWLQRFQNYQQSLFHLKNEVTQYGNTNIDVIKKGIIQSFEITHELSWKLMQDILREEGESELYGSKSATRLAFNRGLINQGEIWLEMIKSRNLTVHTYDQQMINEEFNKIIHLHLPAFTSFEQKVNMICSNLD